MAVLLGTAHLWVVTVAESLGLRGLHSAQTAISRQIYTRSVRACVAHVRLAKPACSDVAEL